MTTPSEHPVAVIDDRSVTVAGEVDRSRRICRWIIAATLLLGMFERIKHYVDRPSYWNDEAAVVINIMQRDWRQLLNQLDYAQAAPPLFLWSEKSMERWFGPGEYSLRLLPMLCGLAVLPLYARLAWRVLSPVSACWAVAWFTFFQKLSHRANDVKQYSGDVLAAVLMLLVVFGPREATPASRRVIRLSICSAIALWFSFPVPFLYGALSLVLLPECFRTGRSAVITWVLGNGLVTISFAGLSGIALTHRGDPSLLEFWAASFPDFHRWYRIPLWTAGEVYGLFGYPFDSFGAITTLLAVLGVIALVRVSKQVAGRPAFSGRVPMVLLFALTLAFVAATLHRYPFPGRHRLGLYLIPVTMLILGAAADPRNLSVGRGLRKWWWILTVPLLALEVGNLLKGFVYPQEDSTTRPVVDYVKARRQASEPIYLFGDSLSAGPASGRSAEFLCYWPTVPGNVTIGFVEPRNIPETRVWAVYSLNRPETKSPTYPEKLFTLFGPNWKIVGSFQPGQQSGAMLLERAVKPVTAPR